jgi:structure-specific endonuclease subunit SLX1
VTSLLSNLHLLLRVPSFSRWPLEVRFFSEDAHQAWVRWSSTAAEPLRESLEVIKDLPSTTIDPPNEAGSPRSRKQKATHGIGALDINYTTNKPHVEKGKNVIDLEREGSCSICQTELEHDAGIYTICANPSCEAVTHLACLSKHFLACEDDDVMVPIRGTCPSCKTELKWVDIVKELSLRMRGQKEVEKLLKKKRVRKATATSTSQAMVDSSADDDDDESLDEDDGVNDFILDVGASAGDNWHEIDDGSESDTGSIPNHTQSQHPPRNPSSELTSLPVKTTTLPIVIEDSDWDDAEVLD